MMCTIRFNCFSFFFRARAGAREDWKARANNACALQPLSPRETRAQQREGPKTRPPLSFFLSLSLSSPPRGGLRTQNTINPADQSINCVVSLVFHWCFIVVSLCVVVIGYRTLHSRHIKRGAIEIIANWTLHCVFVHLLCSHICKGYQP